jgi:hypothetical protein
MSPHAITVSGPSSMSPGVTVKLNPVPVTFHAATEELKASPGTSKMPLSFKNTFPLCSFNPFKNLAFRLR